MKVKRSFATAIFCPFTKQENQVAHDVQQYKMKPAENGQPEPKTQLEEISLVLGWVWAHLIIINFVLFEA